VIVNATGLPGASKSTALFTAAAIYGPPDRYVINGTENGATTHFRSTRMHLLSNLPFCLDEVTNIAADVARNWAMSDTQPGIRGRLNPDGTPKKSFASDKSSITMSTANISLHSLLAQNNAAGSAAAVRVLEMTFQRLGIHKTYQVTTYLRELRNNYGHIGERYLRFVTEYRERCSIRVLAVLEALEKDGGMLPDERFWFAAAASALTGIDICNRLGLIRYNPKTIRQWFLDEQVPLLRGSVGEELNAVSPLSVITSYIASIHGDIVKTGSASENIYYLPNSRLMGHYDVDKEELILLKEGFRNYCQTKHQHAQPLLRRLLDEGVISEFDVRRTIGAGTNLAKGQATCFIVNMIHPSIASTETKKELLPPNIVPIRGPRK
jgi:hypothetical protein